MSTVPLTINVPRIITRKVRNLRWLVRGYVALEGVAAILVTAGICFWLALGIDWFLEPTPALRVVMWGSVLAIVGYVAWKKLFSRIFTRLPDSSLALLVERTFPNIDQSLVTSIEMAHQPLATSSEQRALYTRTCEEAARRLAEIPLGQVFRYRPLLWTSIGAALLSASMVVFALAHAETFDFWLQRMRLSPTPWPRTVNLQVVGMEQVDGEWVVNVARDDNYELHVEASLADQFVAPEQVEIRYQLVDGRKGRDSMTQVGNAIAGQDATQAFRYEFKNLTGDIRFDLVGGDDRVGNLRLHVVERPQIVHTTAECVYPKYLGWEPQSLPFSGRVELPYGSQVRCSVEVNKPLLSARAYDPSTQQELAVDMAGEQAKKFTFTLGDFRDERVLLVDLRDTDSVSNREPYRILFSVVPDEVPEVSAQLRGIGSAITPQAVLPIVGTLVDDHGIEAAWIEAQVGSAAPQRRPITHLGSIGREDVELDRFDLMAVDPTTEQRQLVLTPGEQLTLSLHAQDAYDLDSTPHVGSSQRFVLDVVTDSQLRALLEKRELGLRQRFEAIYEKMLDTRELLARIAEESQVEPAEPPTAEIVTQQQERYKLRLSSVQQSVVQLSYETLGVAESFEEIVIELENNRIDTKELTERLQAGIADPLRTVSTEEMPALGNQVQAISALESHLASTRADMTTALVHADDISSQLKAVLDRMLELESYNELVDLLRGILDEQKQLTEETRARRREKLRSLLDE